MPKEFVENRIKSISSTKAMQRRYESDGQGRQNHSAVIPKGADPDKL